MTILELYYAFCFSVQANYHASKLAHHYYPPIIEKVCTALFINTVSSSSYHTECAVTVWQYLTNDKVVYSIMVHHFMTSVSGSEYLCHIHSSSSQLRHQYQVSNEILAYELLRITLVYNGPSFFFFENSKSYFSRICPFVV